MNFSDVVQAVKGGKPKSLAVAVAQDLEVLEAVTRANREGLTNPVLVGNEKEIIAVAQAAKLDIKAMTIVNEPDNIKAVKTAVHLVHDGKADVLMKGLVGTADFMRGVLNKEWGLSTGKPISFIAIIDSARVGRFLFITDPAIVPYPDLSAKIDLINNVVPVARAMGIDKPKVACLAAVEVVNPKMQATLDAAALAKMSDRGQFQNCVIDGPFALDNALSVESAKHKKITSPVAGLADILLAPNIETGNSLYKSAKYIGGCPLACITVGAKAPLIITSRADDADAKFYSIASALYISGSK
jgi:phosphate butyryltransferase